jgi:hypothetical protein
MVMSMKAGGFDARRGLSQIRDFPDNRALRAGRVSMNREWAV